MSKPLLIISDVDGTLIRDDKSISHRTRETVSMLVREGRAVFVLASSRMPASLFAIQKDLGITAPVIAYNGAIVLSGHSFSVENTLHAIALDRHCAMKIVALARTIPDVHIGVFIDDTWFVRAMDYWTSREIRGTRIDPISVGDDGLMEILRGHEGTVYKVVFRAEKPVLDQIATAIADKLTDKGYMYRANDTFLEILPSGATKDAGMAIIQRHIGIDNSLTIAVGDNDNDLGMVRNAGLGIAVANATARLKEAAAEQTLSNNEDGVAAAIERHFSQRSKP